MNSYEKIEQQAYEQGIHVVKYDFRSPRIRGLYCDECIAVNKNIETTIEVSCVVAEELGHHNTSSCNILDIKDPQCAKQERQARLWAYNEKIGLNGLIRAYESGCKERHEVAEFLEVTCEFLEDALTAYRNKYGVCTTVDNYVIFFIPNLLIGRIDM